MKPLKELRNRRINAGNTSFYVRDLARYRGVIDLDVYLPTKGYNLQRGHVWSLRQKQELIWSIWLERWIPPIAVMSLVDRSVDDVSAPDILQIIDGKQRISAVLEFVKNKFPVTIEGHDYFYEDLPKDYQSAIWLFTFQFKIVYEELNTPFTDQEKIDWFLRLNFSGTPQDERHKEKLLKNV